MPERTINRNPKINPVKYIEWGNDTIPPPTIVLIIANTAFLELNLWPVSEIINEAGAYSLFIAL